MLKLNNEHAFRIAELYNLNDYYYKAVYYYKAFIRGYTVILCA